MVKVSVIMPIYNVAPYLRECLDSVCKQTLREIQIICVDDGSSDGSLEILREYEAADPRVLVLAQKNSGAGQARNYGLQHVQGEYISLLDGDDFFEPDMLEKAYAHARRHSAQVTVFKSKRFYEESGEYRNSDWAVREKDLPQKACFAANEVKEDIFGAIQGYTWNKLFETAYIRELGIEFQNTPVFNDAFFVYAALISAQRIAVMNEYLVVQRIRAMRDSTTNRRSLYTDCSWRCLRALQAFIEKNGLMQRFGRDFHNYAVHLLGVDLESKADYNRSVMLSCLRSGWMQDLGLFGHGDGYYYEPEKYHKLLECAYHGLEEPDLSCRQTDGKIVIPVVFASDIGYLNYTLVSMCSLLEQPAPGVAYRFVYLVPFNAQEDFEGIIHGVLSKYSNYTLEVHRVGEEFVDAHLEIQHITTPTYYRLLLPDLLPDCSKCIYIDGDTVICEDLVSLYTIPMGENYLAAAPAYVYHEKAEYHSARLGFDGKEPFRYYNAGVLLMNLEAMRRDGLQEKMIELSHNAYESQDQDVLNVACRGRIKPISLCYNMMVQYHKWEDARWLSLMSAEQMKLTRDQMKKPVIIHYSNKIKPWNNFRVTHSRYWWRAVLSTPCWALFREEKLDMVMAGIYSMNLRGGKKKLTLSYLLEKARGGVQCYKDNGLRYTVRRLGQKIAGRAADWYIVRKIRGGVRCLKENGLAYTFRRLLEKIRRRIS
ncbi:MAG: glycosyltransferase [Clostridia bacterium]|nr:glycosyltransferase [Clostridia bacterium]